MNATALFSSASAEWATPQWLFDALNARFLFTLDPCCTASTAKCPKFYTRTDDGLAHSWAGERVFMNPPYGRGDNGIEPWVRKARGEAVGGALVVGLLPARVDTEWWQENVQGHALDRRENTALWGVNYGGISHGSHKRKAQATQVSGTCRTTQIYL